MRSPDDAIGELLQFVGEAPAEMGDMAISEASLGRWRRDLTADEQATVRKIAGGLLDELGYTASDPW